LAAIAAAVTHNHTHTMIVLPQTASLNFIKLGNNCLTQRSTDTISKETSSKLVFAARRVILRQWGVRLAYFYLNGSSHKNLGTRRQFTLTHNLEPDGVKESKTRVQHKLCAFAPKIQAH